MKPALIIEDGGLSTTVQDTGRFGYQHLGIPASGALDLVAMRLANALIGNDQYCAALEIRMLGPTIRVAADSVRVALTGTATPIQVIEPERKTIQSNRSVLLARDTTFRIGPITDSSCCYLAIEGGLTIKPVLESYSTYLRGGIGGYEGRALGAGDEIPLQLDRAPDRRELRAEVAAEVEADPVFIHVVPGPQADYFTAAGTETFFNNTYTVTNQTDRMGMRLDGPTVEHASGFNIPSDGIVTGAIQVPGNGLPIILLADRQTTGGYPKIACVASADLGRLARLRPGTSICFKNLSVGEAENIRASQEQNFKNLVQNLKAIADDASSLEESLMRENLISGGEWMVNESKIE